MADHLLRKFPQYEKIIERHILGIDDEQEDFFGDEEENDDMTHLWEIWKVMKEQMQCGRTYKLQENCDLVEQHCDLKRGDFEPQAPGSSIPKWKRNVRNVLQKKKEEGEVIWSGRGEYRIV